MLLGMNKLRVAAELSKEHISTITHTITHREFVECKV